MRSAYAIRRMIIACSLGLLAGCAAPCAYTVRGDTGIPTAERALLSVTLCLNDACSSGTIDSATQAHIELEGESTAELSLSPDPVTSVMGPGTWGFVMELSVLPDKSRPDRVSIEIHDDVASRDVLSLFLAVSDKSDDTCIDASVVLAEDGGGGSGGGG